METESEGNGKRGKERRGMKWKKRGKIKGRGKGLVGLMISCCRALISKDIVIVSLIRCRTKTRYRLHHSSS